MRIKVVNKGSGLSSIHRDSVIKAIDEFNKIGLNKMLHKYGGGVSMKWYIHYNGKNYDQKLICRAAHSLQGLGPLPPGPGTFKAGEARRKLEKLGFDVRKLND